MSSNTARRELYQRLLGYLTTLVNNRFFWGKSEHQRGLREPLGYAFQVARWLANDLGITDGVIGNLHGAFKSNYGDPGEVETFTYSTDEDLAEQVNYLKVCTLNLCKIDLDTYTKEDLIIRDKNAFFYRKEPDSSVVFKNFFNVTAEPGDTESAMNEILIQSHAWDRLNKDITSGNLYIYKDRPERNVRIKKFLDLICILGIFFSMLLFLYLIIGGTLDLNSGIISAYCPLFFGLFLYRSWRASGNDNFLYSFQRNVLYSYGIFASIFMAHLAITQVGNMQVGDAVARVMWYILSCLVASNFFIYLFSFVFLNPKKDKQLLDDTLKQHMINLSNE